MSAIVEHLTTTTCGIPTRYSRAGTGPAVVMLHGGSIGCSLDIWDEVSLGLADDGLCAIALDLPGYGRTAPPSDLSPEFVRRFIVAFIEGLELGRVHLVGHSGNGGTAIRIALEHPGLLSSVTVVGTGSLLPELPNSTASEPQRDEMPDGEPTIEWVRTRLLKEVYDPAVLTPERVGIFHELSTGENYRAAVARTQVRSTGAREPSSALAKRLNEVTVPLMLVYGTGDKNGAGERFPLLREAHPTLETHLIENSRHFIPVDAPGPLRKHLSRFVLSSALA